MTLGHIFVIVFMLLTVGFIVWLEMNSRKNTKQHGDRAARGTHENASRDS